MRQTSLVLVGLTLVALVGLARIAAAQPVPPPTIHRVTVQPDTGVLTVTGTGLGPDLQVTVDGQPVPQLPGATATQLEVLAPVTVVTQPGTYRLTVVDPMRRVGDGFVVVSPTSRVPMAGEASPARGPGDRPPTASEPAAPRSVAGPAATTASRVAAVPPPLTVIEDPASPYRTAIGHQALFSNTTGGSNTASGYRALYSNTTGSSNTATGLYALLSNTIGNDNTASGSSALASNTTGDQNTASGAYALALNTTGTNNTASGVQALQFNTTGSNNTASGYQALIFNTTGLFNTAGGGQALRSNTTGSNNTASGYQALYLNTTGNANVAFGVNAGQASTTGSYNVFLGTEVSGTAADTNTIRLGRPYDSGTGAGQNQTFIAGIRGTTVTGGEAVFIDAAGKLGSGPITVGANSVGSAAVIDDSLTASDLAPNAVTTSELAADAVTAAKVAFNYAASASEGGAALDVACVGCVDATEVAFSYASLGANTFAATQTIGAGDLDFGSSTATTGNLTKNGARFLHDFGVLNVFLGRDAGNFTMLGSANTAGGAQALQSNTTGGNNTASGYRALFSNTTGAFNTAGGALALRFNTTGVSNTASGYQALYDNTTGLSNTASGYRAGRLATTGSYNVFLGADVTGTATDTNTMRLGLPYDGGTGVGQNQTFIAGIHGTQLPGPAVQVYVDANGQLGTLTPPIASGSGTTPAPMALQQQVEAQQAINTAQQATNKEMHQRSQAQQATIDDLLARIARLEASGTRRR